MTTLFLGYIKETGFLYFTIRFVKANPTSVFVDVGFQDGKGKIAFTGYSGRSQTTLTSLDRPSLSSSIVVYMFRSRS